jgi:peptide-methionine (S)-S-oxide reductase
MANVPETAIFGGGCFWCTEAIFQRLKGVQNVASGYAGGDRKNPSYEDVCTGKTGHAEVIKIEYDPEEISFRDLLAVFFSAHDPTTPNRQGNDVGPQYRSIILYTTPDQKNEAEKYVEKLTDEKTYDKPITTGIKPYDKFYPAEGYHQDYYEKNQNQPYCQLVINPKLAKLKEKHSSLIKP